MTRPLRDSPRYEHCERLVNNFGVYVHVPFCKHRCDYCAFATYDDRDDLMARYVAAVRREISEAVEAGLPPATSVFFCGGTPSRLPAEWLLEILQEIPRTPESEVTVECNPEDASPERLSTYRAGGVTRMSFGVQSTQSHVLADLGRRHGTHAHREVSEAVTTAGFATWNMDLIVGSRAETLRDVASTLRDLLELEHRPPHISCYALTAEPATPLGRDPARHPDEDATADAYDLVGRTLAEAGYEWEEISNWAQPGHEGRHNHVYWRNEDYRGFGSAAHSHSHGTRFWNVRTPNRYIELVESGQSPRGGHEALSREAQQFERESLALRTREGVEVSAFTGLEEVAHLVEIHDGRVRLRPEGRLLANQVILRLTSSAHSSILN